MTEISLFDLLDANDYYRTDAHWRQENLEPVVSRITQAMGVPTPDWSSWQPQELYPFQGVYLGQSALPVEPTRWSTCKTTSPTPRRSRRLRQAEGIRSTPPTAFPAWTATTPSCRARRRCSRWKPPCGHRPPPHPLPRQLRQLPGAPAARILSGNHACRPALLLLLAAWRLCGL